MLKVELVKPETQALDSNDLPAGKYLFEIMEVTQKVASTGRGRLGLHLKVADGATAGAMTWDNWNLPTDEDEANSYIRKFWKTVLAANPSCYANGELDETRLKGIQYNGTVTYEMDEKTGREWMRIRNVKFAEVAAKAATSEVGSTPRRFAQP